MRTLTFEAENYVERQATIEVLDEADNIFTYNGDYFQIVLSVVDHDGELLFERAHLYRIDPEISGRVRQPIAFGTRDNGSDLWYFEHEDIIRDHQDYLIAAGKILAMVW